MSEVLFFSQGNDRTYQKVDIKFLSKLGTSGDLFTFGVGLSGL